MSASPYDVELLEAARAGDQEAICTLLALAQPDIRRYAQRSCAAADDVNDAVQETLWLMYRRIGTLRAMVSLSAWLFAVVRRECWRLARKALSKTVELNERDHHARFSYRPQSELRVDLARAIQSLPEHYREVILLRDVEEMTVDEIALALNKSREGVKAIIHRARLLLREYLLQ